VQRSLFNLKTLMPIVAMLLLVTMSDSAFAQVTSANIYETILDRYQAVASSWATVIIRHATWLFWTLALISLVWTFGMMALRKADIQEFFAEFAKFTIFTGFFWWLLTNGPHFADTIIRSMRQIGGEATGLGVNLTPSSVSDIGFDVFFNTLDKATMRSPLVSLIGIVLGLGILMLLALVAVNMLILLVSSWVLLYGGVFFLGFGGSRWTSDMAINYYKTVLGMAASLFSMVLIIGVATSVMDQYYRAMGQDIQVKELAVVLVVAFIMAMLVKSVPQLISGIITGASVGQGASMGFGTGALVGAGAMAAAAFATGGAAIAAGAAGGAQALMAAFSKANAEGNAGGGAGDLMATSGGGSDSGGLSGGGGSALASAMGGNSGASAFETRSSGGSSTGGVGSGSELGGSSRQSGGAEGSSKAPKDGGGSESGGASASSDAKVSGAQGGISLGGGNSDASGSGNPDRSNPGSNDAKNSGSADDRSTADKVGGGSQSGGSAAKGMAAQSGNAPSKVKSSSTLAAVGALAAKVGKVSAGTAANLALGSWDVTKAKGSELKEAALDRIGETTGGKIAAAIRARDAASKPGASMPSTFDDNSLSAGTNESADADSEVAVFRDRDPKPS
jgi:type IV secretion system protein TrbL